MTTKDAPYHAAPSASRYQVIGPVMRGKDLVVATIARVETGDEEQDKELAERIAAALNFCDGLHTSLLVESRAGRAT